MKEREVRRAERPARGAAVAEYGLRDIVLGASGDANGYLVFIAFDRDSA